MNRKLQKVIKELEGLENVTLIKGGEKTLENALKVLGDAPSQVKEFYSLFDGAFLGSSQFASTRKKHKGLVSESYTLREINSKKLKKQEGIADELVCFGVENTGDPVCFKKGGKEKVYSFYREEGKLIEYSDLADYLKDQIDNVLKAAL